MRAENPDLGFGDIGKKIATLWNAKSTKEKEEVSPLPHVRTHTNTNTKTHTNTHSLTHTLSLTHM